MADNYLKLMGLGHTSAQLDAEYPFWRNQSTSKGGHNTQRSVTISTYKNIAKWIQENTPTASILDASSGLGHGTEYMKSVGLNCIDVEPFPSKERKKPDYTDYKAIKKKFDIIISNAVVNVIPNDWRESLILNMGQLCKKGGFIIINTRKYGDIAKTQGIMLTDPGEKLVPNGKDSWAYQKGFVFTKKHFINYIQGILGSDFHVEKATAKNCGVSVDTAVICYKK